MDGGGQVVDADGAQQPIISQSSALVNEAIKNLGKVIAEEARKDGGYISPLLAAFTARVISLENPR